MRKSKGALMHDRWTHNSTHYVGLFALYNRNVKVLENGTMTEKEESVYPLLAVSPMANIDHEDEESSQSLEASTFSAEFRRMIELDGSLSSTIDSIHDTMKSCKTKLKNRALLRNISHLNPVLHNVTRWSSTYHMIKRFNLIRDDLITVSNEEDSNLDLDKRAVFKTKAEKYSKQLGEINYITLELQTRGITLADSRLLLDELINAVRSERSVPESSLYQCRLGTHYIGTSSSIVKDADFENGVVKIQRMAYASMTDAEKNACKGLLNTLMKIMKNQTTFNGYWDDHTVKAAMARTKTDRVRKAIQEDEMQADT
eukprot:IDg2370t1